MMWYIEHTYVRIDIEVPDEHMIIDILYRDLVASAFLFLNHESCCYSNVPEHDEADGMGDCCRARLDPLALRLLGGAHVPPDKNRDPLVPSRSCPHPWRVLRPDHSIQVILNFCIARMIQGRNL